MRNKSSKVGVEGGRGERGCIYVAYGCAAIGQWVEAEDTKRQRTHRSLQRDLQRQLFGARFVQFRCAHAPQLLQYAVLLLACQYDESSECATTRQHTWGSLLPTDTDRSLMGCANPLLRRSVHTVRVLELTKNEMVGGDGRRHWLSYSPCKRCSKAPY